MRNHNHSSKISAGSMADIAFLLLIFFLVTTTIVEDQGLLVKLPPWDTSRPLSIDQDRVLSVYINGRDELRVEDQTLINTEDLIHKVETHLASKGFQPILSLMHDRETTYKKYIEVYDNIKMAYRIAWNDLSNEKYKTNYSDLSSAQRKEIKKLLPYVVSEAEPTAF